MFSIRGTFKDNQIQLSEPLKLKGKTNIIITFLNSEGEEEQLETTVQITEEGTESAVQYEAEELAADTLNLAEADELDDSLELADSGELDDSLDLEDQNDPDDTLNLAAEDELDDSLDLENQDELDEDVSLDLADDSLDLEDQDEDVSLDLADDFDNDEESFEADMLVDEDDRDLIDDEYDTDEDTLDYDLVDDGEELSLDDDLADDEILDLDPEEDDVAVDLDTSLLDEEDAFEDEFSEKDYSKIRKHKRFKAKGSISLQEDGEELEFPLFDYSAGGLSFISDRSFEVARSLTASIKDPIDQDSSVLDFEFEVVRVVKKDDKYKIGCKFYDEVDEEIWHSLMS